MPQSYTLEQHDWQFSAENSLNAVAALESGQVLHFPNLRFPLSEQASLSPDLVDPKRKNISFNINKDTLQGVAHAEHKAQVCAILNATMIWLKS